MSKITIEAPARICLFGDHQDYLELPVIACAINRTALFKAVPNNRQEFRIDMPDLGTTRTFSISERFESLTPEDHFASVLRVARRHGCVPNKGYDISINSNIPINAGVSSSSAMVLGWLHFLLTAFGCDQKITPQFLAQLAYEAEVLEHNSPGGKMDQFTIAMGNIIFIDTSKDFGVHPIDTKLDGLVLGVSGIPKETIGLLGDLRGNAEKAIAQVTAQNPEFKISEALESDIHSHATHVETALRPFFHAAVKNHTITKAAFVELQKSALDYAKIGALMSAHHEILKNNLKITVPKIDVMINAALDAGAYGAKIVGSGGGGSIVALAPKDQIDTVIRAIKCAGAKDTYSVRITSGTRQL